MNQTTPAPLRLANRLLLHAASWIAPEIDREDWLREWQAELWHVEHCAHAPQNESRADRIPSTAFVLGAFSDAVDLRRNTTHCFRLVRIDRSAWTTLLFLGVVFAGAFSASCLLPGAYEARHAGHFQIRPNLILVQNARSTGTWAPSITFNQFRRWKNTPQQNFSELAFYRLGTERVGDRPTMRVAWASSNLFSLLDLHSAVGALHAGRWPAGAPAQVVLSDELWRSAFASDPQLVGRTLQVGSTRARVAAILPSAAWRLPGEVGLWVLVPDEQLAKGASDTPGYLVAAMKRHVAGFWNGTIYSSGPEGEMQQFMGLSLNDRTQGTFGIFFFTLLLALLALPAVVSASREDVQVSPEHLRWDRILLRRVYLAAKFVLVASIAYYASLDFAFGSVKGYQPTASSVQFLVALLLCLLGLRWAVLDQQGRCPICLRRVDHPATVGMASHTFLAWSGTELMCTGGHTLLHVPGSPTSWFHAPRWVYLDASWEFLFSE